MSVYDGNVGAIVSSPTSKLQSTGTAYHSIRARRERANQRRTPADAVTDPNITGAGLRFLLLIQKAGGTLYETQYAIADKLRVSRITVCRAIRYLQRAGYLLIRRGRPNGYFLNDGRSPEETRP